jgi:hypothetical protein
MRINAPRSNVPDTMSGFDHARDRITATESIDGVMYKVILESDARGCYREVRFTPLDPARSSSLGALESRTADTSTYLG